MKVAILGCGNMARAIATSVYKIDKGIAFYTYTPSFTSALSLAELIDGIAFKKISEIPAADIYLIACKPQQFNELAKELAPILSKNSYVISLMAGVSLDSILNKLGGVNVSKVMPNTPILYGQGISFIFHSPNLPGNLKKNCDKLFGQTSLIINVDNEDDLHGLTAIVGSGPGHIFYLAACFLKNLNNFLSETESRAVINALFKGSSSLMDIDKLIPLDVLRKNVTSERGITQSIHDVFDKKHLELLIDEGIQAGIKRSREIQSEMSMNAK